ncbi:hypothetical protein [Mucilaginibacter lacusdianchii]|uniref:hypothetical protein n=1 Tax=Mucilaginibacter lacusdianchii TaxID=2684211 RepID=UPI00131D57C4|nr:hypothetical protein [Mucilaginibacter sp. JXJ CY 39]
MKEKAILLAILLYITFILMFTWYWSFNYHKYTHFKGDESFYFVKILVFSNYLFLIVAKYIIRFKGILALIWLPLLNVLLSVLAGLVLFLSLNIGGTTVGMIKLYGVLFALISILSAWPILKKMSVAV